MKALRLRNISRIRTVAIKTTSFSIQFDFLVNTRYLSKWELVIKLYRHSFSYVENTFLSRNFVGLKLIIMGNYGDLPHESFCGGWIDTISSHKIVYTSVLLGIGAIFSYLGYLALKQLANILWYHFMVSKEQHSCDNWHVWMWKTKEFCLELLSELYQNCEIPQCEFGLFS